VLLFPGPHRFQQPGDGTAGPLIEGLVHRLGRQVISFDPPGSGHSTRPPKLSMEEMLECANETLELFHITEPIDIFGHSMGGLCALAYAVKQSQSHSTNKCDSGRVKRLVLVGTGSGGPAYMKAPGALWNASHAAFWKMAFLGVLQMVYQCEALQNIMLNFIDYHSYVDRQRWFVPRPIRMSDWFRRKSGHSEWHAIAKNLDYRNRLGDVTVPTLLLCGRHDVQYPVACTKELADGMPNACEIYFDASGHYPFIEERDAFWRAVSDFFNETSK
jgi:proline iminopeptidase